VLIKLEEETADSDNEDDSEQSLGWETDATAIASDDDDKKAPSSSDSAAGCSESGKSHLMVLLEDWLPHSRYQLLRERISNRRHILRLHAHFVHTFYQHFDEDIKQYACNNVSWKVTQHLG